MVLGVDIFVSFFTPDVTSFVTGFVASLSLISHNKLVKSYCLFYIYTSKINFSDDCISKIAEFCD